MLLNGNAPVPAPAASAHVFDATTTMFEAEVLQASTQTPVLLDFWADWCEPCKTLGPMLEKLAAEYNGAFVLAKVDVEKEQQVAAAFQIRSVPTVFLVVDGQPLDGFPGALPESEIREFLTRHGIVPGDAAPADDAPPAPLDPHADAERLRAEIAAAPDKAELKLDLALVLLQTGATQEAEQLLDGLPANLSTDDRAVKARARLGFAAVLAGAPSPDALQATIDADAGDLRARYLLGVQHIVGGDAEAGLVQFIELLRLDRDFDDGLPRKALIDAFRIIDDAELVGRYRRKMASLLF